MILNDLFQHAPDRLIDAFNHALCALDVLRKSALDELFHDERLKELQRHFLGEAALVHLQIGADNDNAAAGIVHALT
ncbi:hypothetical protein SDC9_115795 [bioreactor metagenome]|uniref:Uncharacterized protein n=1 Tax=bioreactor metagenome TaxID=1076179 RepID=A0A645BTW2_9ZZZZ